MRPGQARDRPFWPVRKMFDKRGLTFVRCRHFARVRLRKSAPSERSKTHLRPCPLAKATHRNERSLIQQGGPRWEQSYTLGTFPTT
jgi:hypothetical protein